MSKNPFRKEQAYGLLFFAVAVLTALLTGQWAWSFLLWALIYILWKWVELHYFYNWYKKGADNDATPLNHGIWKELSSLVSHNKGRNQKIKRNNQYLLNQFNTMAQAMPYATVLLNKKFEIIWANQSSIHILNIVLKKDKNSKIGNIILEPAFVKTLHDDLQESDIKIQHPHDAKKRIFIRLVRLSKKRILLVARDISQQDALRQSRKAFVANASHELRTPLTVIAGYLEILHNADEVPQQWQTAIKQSLKQSTRMEKIIDDMLKLSSIEHERYMEDADELIDMPDLLNRLFNDVKNSSKAKKHCLIANIDSSLQISGNESEITSICLNLLNNAVIHTQKNTNVTLRWFKEDNKANLWIWDDGDGIDAKHIPHLSERFYRVDNSRNKNTDSTGLGLAIVKQICDNHGAVLEIQSDIHQGSCFKIIFAEASIV